MRHHFGEAARDRVARFVNLVIAENTVQNLVAPMSVPQIWARHVVDSAQLLALAPDGWARWIDIGTGGGFPGMVVALLAPDRGVLMVEPRKRRADFLQRCIDALELSYASVAASKVESIHAIADVISARAVASPENLLRSAAHCATVRTTWLLPRGRSGADDTLPKQRVFHVEHSVTDAASVILVARGTLA